MTNTQDVQIIEFTIVGRYIDSKTNWSFGDNDKTLLELNQELLDNGTWDGFAFMDFAEDVDITLNAIDMPVHEIKVVE